MVGVGDTIAVEEDVSGAPGADGEVKRAGEVAEEDVIGAPEVDAEVIMGAGDGVDVNKVSVEDAVDMDELISSLDTGDASALDGLFGSSPLGSPFGLRSAGHRGSME